jgi:sulfide:quinone oxidoreductase
MNASVTPKVVVLGSGFGGLEAAFYLRMRVGERASITVVSDKDYFLFKPNTIYIPFGLDPDTLKLDLARPFKKKDVQFVRSRARGIDTGSRMVQTEGHRIPYDYLIVSTGAGMRASEVPGLAEHSKMIWTPHDMLGLRQAFYDLQEAAREGEHRKVLFLVPPTTSARDHSTRSSSCSIPGFVAGTPATR